MGKTEVSNSINSSADEQTIGSDSRSAPHEPSRLRAGLILTGSALAVFSSVGFLNAFGIFQAYYAIGPLRDHSEFQISWIGSFSTFLFFMGALPAGILSDKFGPRLPLCFGMLFSALGIFTLSACKEYYQFFLAQGVVSGIGFGLTGMPAFSAVAATFKKNRSLGIGATVGGSSIGGLIWPVVVNKLLNTDGVDFGWTMRTCGFIMLACMGFAVLTVPLASRPRAEPKAGEGTTKVDKKAILKRPPVIVLCIAMATTYFGLFIPFFFVSSYALTQGVDTSLSFYMVSILNGASLFGRLLGGLLADRFGAFNMNAAAILSSAVICFCFTAAHSPAGIIVFAAAYGFTSGSIMSLQAACAAQLATPETYGLVIGTAMGSAALTGLFGTPIAGELVNYGYLALSMWGGATLLLGGSLIISAKFLQNSSPFARV